MAVTASHILDALAESSSARRRTEPKAEHTRDEVLHCLVCQHTRLGSPGSKDNRHSRWMNQRMQEGKHEIFTPARCTFQAPPLSVGDKWAAIRAAQQWVHHDQKLGGVVYA